MTYETITIDRSPRRIATVTLNRPDRGNAFNQTMLDELGTALAALAADAGVRIVVLRGAGKHFCTGADLSARGPSAPAAKHTLRDVLALLDGLVKPTVAVIQGGAIGGGAGLATCCDVTIATEAAFFSIPEVRVGMPPFGIMPFMIRAIGHRAFRRYGLSGERIAASEALRLGLVHELCELAALEGTLARIADELLLGAPHAMSELKAAAARYATPNLDQILAHIHPPHDPKSVEAQEGLASFREKRKPSWYPQ
ncbi:MAG: enoyl-CoA hydratase/isomerase family protein [Hyphomicrobiales bacterium]|nr:enoyl-CoA hydratase/isomerase family protein [Hyphomicrobiales bacterium]